MEKLRAYIEELKDKVASMERQPLDDVDFHGKVPTLKRVIERLEEIVDPG